VRGRPEQFQHKYFKFVKHPLKDTFAMIAHLTFFSGKVEGKEVRL
jgi:hypothetical protein